jgi:hypothetical protein
MSICRNRRGSRESLVLVVVLIIVIGAIEDENENDLIAAMPR